MADLDVALTLRLINQLSGPAKDAKQDLAALRGAAEGLNGARGGDALKANLAATAQAASTARRELGEVRGAADRLRAADGGTALKASLGATAAAAGEASGRFSEARTAAERLHGVRSPSAFQAELQRIGQTAGQATGRLERLRTVAAKLGGARGPENLSRSISQATRQADGAAGSLGRMSRAVKTLESARGPERLTRELQRAAAAASTAEQRLGAAARKAREAASAGGARTRAGTRLDALKGAGEAGREALYLVPGISGAVAGAATAAGAAGAAAVAGLVGLGAAAASTTGQAIRLETAMAEIRKAVDGLDAAGLQAIEQDILRITRETPLAAEEVAKLYAQAGFAGRPKEELKDFAVFAAKAAVAFGMQAEEAGDKLAKLGNVFKLDQAGIEDTANAINLLGDTTAAKERDIVEFLTRTGAGAQLLKMTANETAALGAAMLELGTAPEVAATGANALMTKLATAGKQGKDFQAALKAIGLDAKKVAELLRKGPAEALIEIGERINKLEDEKKIDVLEGLGGGEYVDDLARLFSNLDGLIRHLARVRDAMQRVGSVEKTFKIFDDTTDARLKKLGNAFANFGTTIGQQFTGPVGRAAEALAELLNKINAAHERATARARAIEHLADGKDPEQLDPSARFAYEADRKGVEKEAGAIKDERARREAKREVEADRARELLPSVLPRLDEEIAQLKRRQEILKAHGVTEKDMRLDALIRRRDELLSHSPDGRRFGPHDPERPSNKPEGREWPKEPPAPAPTAAARVPLPPEPPPDLKQKRQELDAAARAEELRRAHEEEMKARIARQKEKLQGASPKPEIPPALKPTEPAASPPSRGEAAPTRSAAGELPAPAQTPTRGSARVLAETVRHDGDERQRAPTPPRPSLELDAPRPKPDMPAPLAAPPSAPATEEPRRRGSRRALAEAVPRDGEERQRAPTPLRPPLELDPPRPKPDVPAPLAAPPAAAATEEPRRRGSQRAIGEAVRRELDERFRGLAAAPSREIPPALAPPVAPWDTDSHAPRPRPDAPPALQAPPAMGGGIEAQRAKLQELRKELEEVNRQIAGMGAMGVDATPLLQRAAEIEQAIERLEAMLQRLNQVSVAPTVDTASLAAAETKAQAAGPAMKAALEITARPLVDTSSIDGALAKLRHLHAATGGLAGTGARLQAAREIRAQTRPSPPKMSPRISPPGGGGAQQAAARLRRPAPASSGNIQIAAIHVHGVRDLASLEREIQRAADRRARGARDSALHDLGDTA